MKLIKNLITSFLISAISLYLVFYVKEPKNNGENIYLVIFVTFLLIFIYLEGGIAKFSDMHMINRIVFILVNLTAIIFSLIIFEKFWLILIGVILMNIMPNLIKRNKVLLFVVTAMIYPLVVLQTFDLADNVILLWIIYTLITLGYSFYNKYKKTRVYFDDSY